MVVVEEDEDDNDNDYYKCQQGNSHTLNIISINKSHSFRQVNFFFYHRFSTHCLCSVDSVTFLWLQCFLALRSLGLRGFTLHVN